MTRSGALAERVPLATVPDDEAGSDRRPRSRPLWFSASIFSLAYLACAVLGSILSVPSSPFSNFWLPGGLYVAVLLLNRTRHWPWYVAAAFPANLGFDLLQQHPIPESLVFFCGNSFEAVLGAYLVRRFVAYSPNLRRLREVLGLFGFPVLLVGSINATLCSMVLSGTFRSPDYLRQWRLWWSGDAMGILVVGGLVLAWGRRSDWSHRFRSREWLEVVLLVLSLFVAAWVSFGIGAYEGYPYRFLVVPFVTWAGLRFGTRGASAATISLAAFVSAFSIAYPVAHANLPAAEHAVMLQGFLAVVALMGLIPGAVVAELREAETGLKAGQRVLGESESRYRSLYSSMTESVVLHELVCDSAGTPVNYRILDCNASFSDITGISADRAVGSLASQVFGGEIPFLDTYARVVLTGKPNQFETYFAQMDKYFLISVFRPSEGRFATVAADITETRRYERQLERHNRLLGMLREISRRTSAGISNEQVFQCVCDTAVEVGGLRAVRVWWQESDLVLAASTGDSSGFFWRDEAGIREALQSSSGRPAVLNQVRPDDPRAGSCAAIPIRLKGELRGILELYSSDADFFLGQEVLLLEQAAVEIAGAVEKVGTEAARSAAERALLASEERYRKLVTASPDSIVVADAAGRITYASPRALELWGNLSESDVLGKSVLDSVALEDRERAMIRFADAMRGINRSGNEIAIVRPDGTRFDGEINSATLADSDGNPAGVVLVTRDITERKKAALKLREREEYFRRLIEGSTDMIAVVDRAGMISYASPSTFRVLGYPPEELVGQSAVENVHPDDRANLLARFEDILQGRPTDCFVIRIRKSSGEWREIEASGRPISPGDAGTDARIVLNSRDVTERNQLEDQLRRAQKLEAVGQLAGGVAHDFNNILASMLINIGLVKDSPLLDRGIRPALEDLELDAGRAAALTRQLLWFSRRQMVQLAPVDLKQLLSNLVNMLGRLLGENIGLSLDCREALPFIEADSGMIEQVVTNLCVNARDAMPTGGLVKITSDVRTFSQGPECESSQRRPGRFVRIRISDHGCGMKPEVLSRIFEPFFTTKEPGRGSGLGLATALSIARQHHGWIEVESAPDMGSSFDVYLPACEVRELPAKPKTDVRRSAGKETILLVEDEPNVRNMVSVCLKRYGYEVLEAGDGVEAMKLWAQHKTRIAMLFTDMLMPEGMSGRDLAENLRAERPELAVVISSGYSPDFQGREERVGTSVRFLAKPYEIQALVSTVRECLAREE
jgi:PAS domain S-box-containing protein